MEGECDHEMWDSALEVRRMRPEDVGFSLESYAVKSEPLTVEKRFTDIQQEQRLCNGSA